MMKNRTVVIDTSRAKDKSRETQEKLRVAAEALERMARLPPGTSKTPPEPMLTGKRR